MKGRFTPAERVRTFFYMFGSPSPLLFCPSCAIPGPSPHHSLLPLATCSLVPVHSPSLHVLLYVPTRPLRPPTVLRFRSPSFLIHHVASRSTDGIRYPLSLVNSSPSFSWYLPVWYFNYKLVPCWSLYMPSTPSDYIPTVYGK
jgi:hypothetical protein